MKKIFTLTLLFATLLSAQFASAQKTLYVYSKTGDLAAYDVNKVTFDDIFTFTYGDATDITKEMFTVPIEVAFKSDVYKSLEQTPEVGICFSDLNENPTIADGKTASRSRLGGQSFDIVGLDVGTTYYYRAYIKVDDVVYYGDVMSETTLGKRPKIINGHKFIDLGLPSGLLWATCNVGATKSADYGNYYAWGETEPKSNYDWSTYKFGTSYNDMTKYNYTDGKTTLDLEDDAAYINWGSPCRMPTRVEFSELLDTSNCTWTWTGMTASTGSSIYGFKVTSVKYGNSIFLPAELTSDFTFNGYVYWNGPYWTSTRHSGLSEVSYGVRLYSSFRRAGSDFSNDSGGQEANYVPRYTNRAVRPVAEP